MQIEENLLYGNGDKAHAQSVATGTEPTTRVAIERSQLFEEINKTEISPTRGNIYRDGCLKLLSQMAPFQGRKFIITDGANDCGFDALFIDEPSPERRVIHAIQSKLGGRPQALKEDFGKITEFLTDHDSVKSNEELRPLLHLLKNLKKEDGKIQTITYIQYIFYEDSDAAAPTSVSERDRKRIENSFQSEVVDIIEDIDPRIEFEPIRIFTFSDIGMLVYDPSAMKLNVPFDGGRCLPYSYGEDGNATKGWSGLVKLKDLVESVRGFAWMDFLQRGNVRDYLGDKNLVNQALYRSLLEAPQDLCVKHNGIKFVCGGYDPETTEMIAPGIANGGQTINTLLKFAREYEHTPEGKAALENTIEVKIIVPATDKLRRAIIAASNTQSPVKAWEHLATDPAMIDLANSVNSVKFKTPLSQLTRFHFSLKEGDPKRKPAADSALCANLTLLDFVQLAYITTEGSAGAVARTNGFASDGGEYTNKLKEVYGDFNSPYFIDLFKTIAILRTHMKLAARKHQTAGVFKDTYPRLFFAILYKFINKQLRFKHKQKRGHALLKCFLKEYEKGKIELEPIIELAYVGWRRYLKSGYEISEDDQVKTKEGWWTKDYPGGFGSAPRTAVTGLAGYLHAKCNDLYAEEYVGFLRGLWSSMREVGNLIERKGIHEAVKIINADPDHEDYFLFYDKFNVLKKDIPMNSSTDIIDVSGGNNDGKDVWFEHGPWRDEETETNV
jgi:hypothetical protein